MKNESLTALTTARYELLTAPVKWLSTSSVNSILRVLDDKIGYAAPMELYSDFLGIPKSPAPIGKLPAKRKRRGAFLIALCVGHSRAGDSGAYAVNGESEHAFYSSGVVEGVAEKLRSLGFQVVVIDHYQGGSYGTAMRWLAARLKELNVDLAYEFHFNSATPSARGFETLFWHKSKVSEPLAKMMQLTQAEHYPDSIDRGVEPLGDQAHERGTLFCSLPHCPSLILEPFFGSNVEEAREHMTTKGEANLIAMFTDGIELAADSLIEV